MKILKFSAAWCGPCQGLKMTINGIKDQIPLEIEDIDIDKDQELSIKYGIRSVPTMIIVNDTGDVQKRVTGALTADQVLDFVKV